MPVIEDGAKSMTRDDAIKILEHMKTRVCTDDLETTCRVSRENEAIDFAIADMKVCRWANIGWIFVGDRLPELNQNVLVYAVRRPIDGFSGDHVITICKRYVFKMFPSSPGHETWSSPWQYFHTDYEITHWMPLPEGPKEGDG